MAHSADKPPNAHNEICPASGGAEPASLNPSSPTGGVNRSRFIVVMGVSGTGKSTLGAALSDAFHLPFVDGDDLHPPANVAKMSRGEPLDDGDRLPWLDTIRNTAIARVLDQLGSARGERVEVSKTEEGLSAYEESMVQGGAGEPEPGTMQDVEWRPGVIVACSSLKKAYRAVLRGETQTQADRDRSGSTGTSNARSLPTYFVYLKGDRDVLMARMQSRKGHFMKAGMLESQLNTLESPEDEPGVVTVSVEMSTREQVRRIVEMLRPRGRR